MGKQKTDNEVIATMFEVAAKHAKQLADEYLEVSKRLSLIGAGDELERSARVCIGVSEALLEAAKEYADAGETD